MVVPGQETQARKARNRSGISMGQGARPVRMEQEGHGGGVYTAEGVRKIQRKGKGWVSKDL